MDDDDEDIVEEGVVDKISVVPPVDIASIEGEDVVLKRSKVWK